MQLLIFYLTDNRRHFTFPHFIKMLNKSEKKEQWKLLILTHSNDNNFYIDEIKKYQINYDTQNISHDNNYIKKVRYASNYAEQNNFPYVMKCDNDIFIKADALDYMIDNLHLLENSKHLTIGPVLTSGIPGIEYFKEQFLEPQLQEHLDKLFLTTNFYNRDGATYDFLNKHTIQSKKWDAQSFFDSVKLMNHYYKGMHPIRINNNALDFLNECIIRNKNKFLNNTKLDIISNDNSPYLCNSIFCIKTDTYKNIIFNDSLYVDGCEEVPLNKYAWNNNMNHLFVKNGFAIHMYYNWKDNHIAFEEQFCNKFFN
jgi:hypothetical protein